MTKKIIVSILAIASIAILGTMNQACTKDKGKLPVESTPSTPTTPTSTATADPCDTVTYTKHVKPIIQKVCFTCHGPSNPSAGFSLSTYDLVKAKGESGRLAARVVRGEGGFMPNNRAMSSDTIKLINCWIKNGYKP